MALEEGGEDLMAHTRTAQHFATLSELSAAPEQSISQVHAFNSPTPNEVLSNSPSKH
jgi:hypothetical protein